MYRLGIDVGGTNTDAIILDEEHQVVSFVKRHTSLDVGSGIEAALSAVLDDSGIDPKQINAVMLGTTQITNAIVERKKIAKVGVLRLAYPATLSIKPFTYWPQDLVEKLGGLYAMVPGGYEYDGQVLSELDEEAVKKQLAEWQGQVESVAVIGVFSSLKTDQEARVAALVHEVYGHEFPVTQSAEIGSIGFIQRENASILNAGLFKVIDTTITGFKQALADKGVANADLYLTQNDGTLMTAEFAQRFPILTIGSGPTNSIRGAAYLAGKDDAIVVDIGGTTTDLGVLKNGFPRESAIAVEVGGVATNFRMPDILSIGLGGGSIVRVQPDGSVTVGPDSVGYEITEKALCFGGDTLTATDIAVRMGLADVGDKAKVSGVSQEVAEAGLAEIKHMIEVAIDKMKTSADDIEIILVGGGAIIAPDHLAGVAKVIAPEKGGVANAIGASISQISGTVDRIYPYTKIDREEALKQAEVEAGEHAKTAGALPDTLSVVEREEIPLAYDPNQSTRVKIKVVGELA